MSNFIMLIFKDALLIMAHKFSVSEDKDRGVCRFGPHKPLVIATILNAPGLWCRAK